MTSPPGANSAGPFISPRAQGGPRAAGAEMDGDEQEENLSAASRAIKKQLAARTVEVSAATCDDILRAALLRCPG